MNRREAQRVLELSGGFLLDQTRFARGLTDFVDILLILAVTQANVEALMRDPGLQRAYADFDNAPPDDLRRPISINALAYSLPPAVRDCASAVTKLSLSVSSAPRRTASMCRGPSCAASGICACSRRLWPDAGPVRGGRFAGGLPRYWRRSSFNTGGRTAAEGRRTRSLRICPAPGRYRHGDARRSGGRGDLAGGDALQRRAGGGRQGVRGAEVARRLGLPSETVRRRLVRLVEVDACQKHADGVTITDERLAAPDVTGLAEKNLIYLRRMFAGVALLRAPAPSRAEAGG
jgi:hypothetical protein